MDVIHVGLYGDGSRNARRRAEYLSCGHYKECSAYKKGKCFGITCLFSPRCNMAHINRVDGGTKRSKAFATVSSKARSHENYGKLSYPSNSCFAKIDSGMFLCLKFIQVEKANGIVLCKDPGFGFDSVFLENEYITVENFAKICHFHPRAIMGGYISDYQRTQVPMFLRELKQEMPSFYNDLVSSYPDLLSLVPNYAGKRARLSTINRDCKYKDSNGNLFRFDGDFLVCEDYKSFFIPFRGKNAVVRIPVTDDLITTIDDNEQVTEETVFE